MTDFHFLVFVFNGNTAESTLKVKSPLLSVTTDLHHVKLFSEIILLNSVKPLSLIRRDHFSKHIYTQNPTTTDLYIHVFGRPSSFNHEDSFIIHQFRVYSLSVYNVPKGPLDPESRVYRILQNNSFRNKKKNRIFVTSKKMTTLQK